MQQLDNPVITPCDCPCPVHNGQPRPTFTDPGCMCSIVCSSQPLTLLTRQWASALFLTAQGEMWFVAPCDVPPTSPYVIPSQAPYFGERTVWDWSNAGPVHEHHESYPASQLAAALMWQLDNTLTQQTASEMVCLPETICTPPIRYTGVIEHGNGSDEVNIFGSTEDEVYRGILDVIVEWLDTGELDDIETEWLTANPVRAVPVHEPGAAQEWLDEFREHKAYSPYWTVLESSSLRDMRIPITPGR